MLHQLGDALANDCHYSACTWANMDSTERTRVRMRRHRPNAPAEQQEKEKSAIHHFNITRLFKSAF